MPAEHQEVDAAVSEQVALATLAERWVTAKARVTLAVQRRLVVEKTAAVTSAAAAVAALEAG